MLQAPYQIRQLLPSIHQEDDMQLTQTAAQVKRSYVNSLVGVTYIQPCYADPLCEWSSGHSSCKQLYRVQVPRSCLLDLLLK
jgi:hypothetical protein